MADSNKSNPKSETISAQMLELQKSLAKGKTVVGIDIGVSSVNIAQTAIHQGKPTIIKVHIENINFNNEQQREAETIDALKRALSNFKLENADVACTISNQKTIVDHIYLPLMPTAELAEAIRLEVSNSSHFGLENPMVDYRVLGHINDKGVEKINVMVAAVSKASIDNTLVKFKARQHGLIGDLKKLLQVEDLMGLNITMVMPISIALENIIKKSKSNKQETIVTLEIGTVSAELNIYCESQLEFSRKINVTGLDFTKSLTSALFTSAGKIELTMQEAEWIKKEYGIPMMGEEFLISGKVTGNQALSLLRPRLEQLSREVTRSFDFYRDKNRTAKIDRLVLFGGGAMLKGLPAYLNTELGLPVGVGNPVEDVNLLFDGLIAQKEDAQRLSSAIGASLGEAGSINLLPDELRDSKKKFFQRAVASLVGLVFIAGSLLIYLILFLQLTIIKGSTDHTKREYSNFVPQLQDLKSRLLLENYASKRLDMGELLMQLSHLPENVFITGVSLNNTTLSITGTIAQGSKESKALLAPLVENLKKGALKAVRVSSIKEVKGKTSTNSNFIINAKLDISESGS